MKVISICAFLLLLPVLAQQNDSVRVNKIEVIEPQSDIIREVRIEIAEAERLQSELDKELAEESKREATINRELLRLIKE